MKIFCCQLDIAWENKKANYSKVRSLFQNQTVPPESLIVLPEMFSTGFSMNVGEIHEAQPSPTEAFLSALAKEHQSFALGGVVHRAATGRGSNEAVGFNSAGIEIARYRKIHPFSFGAENDFYDPGRQIVLFPWRQFTVAPFVCYDLRFPEIFRSAARRGADLFLIIANWPAKRETHWTALLRARAIENQAFVAGVNRCGQDPKLTYSGKSVVFDPLGEPLAEAGNMEGILSCDLDFEKLAAWRRDFPALKDMRWQESLNQRLEERLGRQ